MDEDRLVRKVFDCSVARSVAEGGRVEQLKLRPGHRNTNDSLGCTALRCEGAMRQRSEQRQWNVSEPDWLGGTI
eukprot:9045-Chlamydomonas_euryale.AAC.1